MSPKSSSRTAFQKRSGKNLDGEALTKSKRLRQKSLGGLGLEALETPMADYYHQPVTT
jgi:hypothetical protein